MSAAPGKDRQVVVAQDISKAYPRVKALAPLSLAFGQGETVALAGPSGSGKTTLLYLLAGLAQPDAGQITIDGHRLSALKPGKQLSRLVSIMHQSHDLVPQLPVLHNVLAGRLGEWGIIASLLSLVWPRERHLAEAALTRLGIADKLQERTSRLSGGEQQRVAIARLLVQSSRVILADEPVSSLDPARAEDMLGLLTGLVPTAGQVLVVSLHSPELIRKYFSRVIGLRHGILQFDMPAKDLSAEVLERLYRLDRSALEGLGGHGLEAVNPQEAGAEIL